MLSRWWRHRGADPNAAPRGDDLDLPHLEMTVRGLADALLAGDTQSSFRGSGIEADSVRPYLVGDDVRAMDWRVTARTGRFHIRERVEERGVQALIVIDRSASLHGGLSPLPGRMVLECSGALCAAALADGHPAGLIQVGDRIEARVPASAGTHQLRRILDSLVAFRPAGRGTGLVDALRTVHLERHARSLVAVVSDFRVGVEEHGALGTVLFDLGRRHDLILIRIRVPGPEALPPVGLVCLRDPETGRTTLVDTSDPVVRQHLLDVARVANERVHALAVGTGARFVELHAREPLRPQLQGLLGRRRGSAA